MLIARMLRDKGVGEYVDAARLLPQRWPQVENYLGVSDTFACAV